MNSVFEMLNQRYPFLSLVSYGTEEYVGIIQNSDTTITSFYDFSFLKSTEEKKLFLILADQWWNESNRTIPVNIFLKHDWDQFKYTIKNFITKDLTVIHGPNVSLQRLVEKRSKRRTVTLINANAYKKS
jgi:hypothetical protein